MTCSLTVGGTEEEDGADKHDDGGQSSPYSVFVVACWGGDAGHMYAMCHQGAVIAVRIAQGKTSLEIFDKWRNVALADRF